MYVVCFVYTANSPLHNLSKHALSINFCYPIAALIKSRPPAGSCVRLCSKEPGDEATFKLAIIPVKCYFITVLSFNLGVLCVSRIF